MNHSEAIACMRKLAAYQPAQRTDSLTADAWAEALADVDYRDALDAIAQLGREPRPAGAPWLIEVREVRQRVAAMRAQRIRDRRLAAIDPPPEVADDPAAYQRWLAWLHRQAAERDWQPPVQRRLPRRPVAQLTARLVATAKP